MNDDDDPNAQRRALFRELAARFAWQLVGVTLIITLIVVIAALTQ